MGCYHPLIRKEYWEHPKKRAADGHYYNDFTVEPAAKGMLGYRLEDQKNQHGQINYQLIPCGKCIGCKLEYSRQWANRGYLESTLWEQNWFVTITYDELHVQKNDVIEDKDGITYTNDGSWGDTLIPEDLKRFIHNVRQIMQRDYGQTGIRYMACGEYGAERERPHYHIIFYNLNLPLDDLYSPKVIRGFMHYKSKILERAWTLDGEINPIGIVDIAEANWNSIAYVARYITKKINGEKATETYTEKGLEAEFFRASNRPGIGFDYYEKHKDKIYKTDSIIIKNAEGVITTKPPKYFDKLYELENPKRMKEIKAARQKAAQNAFKIKMQQTSLEGLEQYEIEERTKTEQTYQLIREFERKAGV